MSDRIRNILAVLLFLFWLPVLALIVAAMDSDDTPCSVPACQGDDHYDDYRPG